MNATCCPAAGLLLLLLLTGVMVVGDLFRLLLTAVRVSLFAEAELSLAAADADGDESRFWLGSCLLFCISARNEEATVASVSM